MKNWKSIRNNLHVLEICDLHLANHLLVAFSHECGLQLGKKIADLSGTVQVQILPKCICPRLNTASILRWM